MASLGVKDLLGRVVAAEVQQWQEKEKRDRQRTITPQELEQAWRLINPKGGSLMTKAEAEQALRSIDKSMSKRDLNQLLAGFPDGVTLDKLQSLLVTNPPEDLDPDAHAFEILDPDHTGYVDMEVLKRILQLLPGAEQVDEHDLKAVLSLADADRDGMISLQDWRVIPSTVYRPSGGGALPDTSPARHRSKHAAAGL